MEHRSAIPEDRPLSAQSSPSSAGFWITVTPSARTYLGEIETLRVVSRCGCGCASVDFVNAPPAGSTCFLITNGKMEQGASFGAFAFAKAGKLAASKSGQSTDARRPVRSLSPQI